MYTISNPTDQEADRHSFDASLKANGSQDYAAKTKRNDLLNRFDEMTAPLIDLETDDIRPQYLQNRNCPSCGAEQPFQQVFVKHKIPVVSCGQCQMIFASPSLSQAGEHVVYEESTIWTDEHAKFLSSPVYVHYAKLRAKYQLSVIEKYVRTQERQHLDIGAAAGDVMEVAQGYGWTSIGVDSNPTAVEIARSKGLDVIDGWYSHEAVGRSFQLVTLLDVLEHVSDLEYFLGEIARSVDRGGLLFIQVPNVASLCTSLVGWDHHSFNGVIHVNYFSAASLKTVVEQFGFKKVHVETILTEMSIIKGFETQQINQCLERYGVDTPADALTADDILDAGLGYKLMAIFERD